MSTDTIVPAPAPDVPAIIARYLKGESLQILAREHAVSRQTIYNWMLAETGADYDQLITQALVNRIADADQAIEESATMFDIARAREMARFARMDFERRRPKLYGPRQELDVDKKLTIIVQRTPQPIATERSAPAVRTVSDAQVVEIQGKVQE